uniref:hypothetical protein n=1 Tax=Candidatus Electronema sp. TaxID=2698783 RepID=UPI0040559C7A
MSTFNLAWGKVTDAISVAVPMALTTAIPFVGPILSGALLTGVTINMCEEIVDVYGYKSLSGMSTFIGVIPGAIAGASIASAVIGYIPGIGVIANCTATTILHTICGLIVISACELYRDGSVSDDELKNNSMGLASSILGELTGKLGDVLRGTPGDMKEAVKSIVKKELN